MPDEIKRLAKDLRLRGLGNPSSLRTHMGLCDEAADLIENLSTDRDAWKRRAEAAERDIAAMLANCECEARHEYCVGCNGESDDCREYAIWRGSCAGNGGINADS